MKPRGGDGGSVSGGRGGLGVRNEWLGIKWALSLSRAFPSSLRPLPFFLPQKVLDESYGKHFS